MKYCFFLIILLFQFSLFSQAMLVNSNENTDLPIMLKIKFKESGLSQSNISIIRLGIEEAITSKKYTLINESTQKEALLEQAKQQKSDCYDDNCIIDTGKMLSAKFLILIDVLKLDKYVFKARYINLETGVSEKVKSFIYEFDNEISNSKKLLEFSKNIVYQLIENNNYAYNRFNNNKYGTDEWYMDFYGYIPAYTKMPETTFGLSNDYYFVNEGGENYSYIDRVLLQFKIRETTDLPFSFWFELNFGLNLYSEIYNRDDIDTAAITFEVLQDFRVTIIDPINKKSTYIDVLSIEAKLGILGNLGTYNDFGFSSKIVVNVLWFSLGTNILYTFDNKMSLGISSGFEIGF